MQASSDDIAYNFKARVAWRVQYATRHNLTSTEMYEHFRRTAKALAQDKEFLISGTDPSWRYHVIESLLALKAWRLAAHIVLNKRKNANPPETVA